MGTVHTDAKRHHHALSAAAVMIVGLLAPTTGAMAYQGGETSPTSFYDEPVSSPDDTVYDEPVSSPDNTVYDDPIYPDDTVYAEPISDDTFSNGSPGDPCDPETYPGWESDPYCNPAIQSFDNTTTTQTATTSLSRFVDNAASQATSDTPLTELDASEATVIGAGRMLLVIDAIAELGGFERAVTPTGANLLRDIREGIPAAGLDEAGYTLELEKFIVDFIPFLESLEADGVIVSHDLWAAAEGLEAVVFDDVDPAADADDLGLLEPQPWLQGLADLLVRGGQFSSGSTQESDERDVRALLEAFAVDVADVPETTTSTTEVPEDSPPPDALALETAAGADEVDPETGAGPALPFALGLGALGLVGIALFLLRRRSSRTSPNVTSPLDAKSPATSLDRTTDDQTETPAAKASVTELLDASRRMSASLDAATIASIALTEAKRIVGAEGGIVVRRTDNGLDPVGCEPPMLFNYEHIADGCLPRVIETGQSTAAIAHDEPLLVEVPMAMGAVPIVTDGIITGAILVVRISAKPFDRDELDALEMLAPLVGSAFAVADTHETAVDVEPLTGLQNRRRLDLDLASISTEEEVAYVMVDIDHFKNFNDTNGHAAGDEALRQVSALLQSSVRPNDLVYRYGGEEFCVLLPATTAQEAAVVAERARAAVESAEIPGMENQPAGKVTISIGVSDSAFGTPDDLVERADAALYVSKRNGRNQVTLSPTD